MISMPIIRPTPRTSPIMECFCSHGLMRSMMYLPTTSALRMPSRSSTFMVASAASMQTGLPPNVEACDPGTQSMMEARVMVIPSGIPEAIPLAMVTMSGSTLHFIGNQQDAVTVTDPPQLRHELRGRRNITAFTLDGLDENRSAFFRRHDGLEYLVFNEPGAIQRELRLGHAFRAAVHVRERNMRHARHQREKAAALLHLGGGKGERAHGASVECTVESNDPLALGMVARQLHGRLHRFSAGIAVVDLYWTGHGSDLLQTLRQCDQAFVVEIRARHTDQLARLFLDGGDNFRMAMPGGDHGNSRGEIQKLIAVNILHSHSAAARGHQRIRTGVGGRDVFCIARKNFLRFRTGELGQDFWTCRIHHFSCHKSPSW